MIDLDLEKQYLSFQGYFMPGVGLKERVMGFGSEGPAFKSHLAVESIPGGVDSACHPSDVGKMRTSLLG